MWGLEIPSGVVENSDKLWKVGLIGLGRMEVSHSIYMGLAFTFGLAF